MILNSNTSCNKGELGPGLVEVLGNARSLACHCRYVGSQGVKAVRERERGNGYKEDGKGHM